MLLGVIADDFTGASDIANTIAKSGMRTTQYFSVPSKMAKSGGEAGVISLKSRSIPPNEAIPESVKALHWLLGQGCEQIVFKYCSTFDSTREGNIGPVGEALCDFLGVDGVVVCPAFPDTGRTVYQGHLFVHNRPLNESGLENHPVNPMTDSNIRRWLRQQTTTPVGLVSWRTVKEGPAKIREALQQSGKAGEKLVVVDAITNDNLVDIGRACAGVRLVTGGSGIALGLAANFTAAGKVLLPERKWSGLHGAEAILAGSCSKTTRSQIEFHKKNHPVFAVDAALVLARRVEASEIVNFILGRKGQAPLAYSSATPEEVARLQETYGREKTSHVIESFFAQCASDLVHAGVKRLVIAGGETSGAVISSLALDCVDIGPEIDPGVPALISHGPNPLAVALKSGNFGSNDFFEKAARMLAGAK